MPTCVLSVEDKIASEIVILVSSCEYIDSCSLRDNQIYLLTVQARVLCLCSLNRRGGMAAFEGILENFTPTGPFWRTGSGVPSTRQTRIYWRKASKGPQR